MPTVHVKGTSIHTAIALQDFAGTDEKLGGWFMARCSVSTSALAHSVLCCYSDLFLSILMQCVGGGG